jgi:type IV pilus assembly protein PilC
MTHYKYKAKNEEGEIYERTFDAPGRSELYAHIREERGTVIGVKEVRSKVASSMFGGLLSGIKTQEKITLAKNLGSMIKAGLSVTRALGVMEKQARRKPLRRLFKELSDDVNKGQTLSDSLKKHPRVFSSLFVSMIRAGEESGNLAETLIMTSSQMEKSHALVKKVRGALIYPAVILCVMVILGILLLIFMVPTLTATFDGLDVELPLSTRIIISSSDFFIAHTLVVVAGLVLAVMSVMWLFRTKIGKNALDTTLVHIPVIGTMVREVESARTARTLSSLLSSGVEVVVALDVTIDVMQNHLYKNALIRVRNAIQKGEAMSVVFAEYPNLYPTFVSEMVSVGEETGKISEMLLGVADYYEEEVDQKTKNLSTIIEPVLMVFIGAAVGVFALSMLAPTYSLVDTF